MTLCTPGIVKTTLIDARVIDRAAERPAQSVFAAFQRMEIVEQRLLDALLYFGKIGIVVDDRSRREFPRAGNVGLMTYSSVVSRRR